MENKNEGLTVVKQEEAGQQSPRALRLINLNPTSHSFVTALQQALPNSLNVQLLNMPPKKQQNQTSSSSKVKVDKVSEIHPYRLSYMPTTYADLWHEECAFHLLATGSPQHRGLTRP